MKFALLITAAGSSVRFGAKKEFLPIKIHEKNTTVLAASLYTFLCTDLFTVCVITIPAGAHEAALHAIEKIVPLAEQKNIPIFFTEGGSSRQESVYCGLQFLAQSTHMKPLDFEGVMVHDGARPWVTSSIICDAAFVTEKHGAAVPAVQTVDTCKEVSVDRKITRHLPRSEIFAVQTPQSFLFAPLLDAHKKAANDGKTYTDDTEIWAAYCGDVFISKGDYANKKITFTEDVCRNKVFHSVQ